MRTDKGTTRALDTQIGFPDRNLEGDIALFPFGSAYGVSAIIRELADPESITIAVDHLTEDFLHKYGSFCRNWRSAVVGAGNLSRISHLVQIRNRLIHCFEVLAYNGFTLATVGLLNGVFNLCQGFFGRQNTADREEAGLHDGVDAAAHASGFSHLIGIDHIKF